MAVLFCIVVLLLWLLYAQCIEIGFGYECVYVYLYVCRCICVKCECECECDCCVFSSVNCYLCQFCENHILRDLFKFFSFLLLLYKSKQYARDKKTKKKHEWNNLRKQNNPSCVCVYTILLFRWYFVERRTKYTLFNVYWLPNICLFRLDKHQNGFSTGKWEYFRFALQIDPCFLQF